MVKTKGKPMLLTADTKLLEAFWRLIPQHKSSSITVKRIVDEAECSRATFYYHFEDISELISIAVTREISMSRIIPLSFRAMISDDWTSFESIDDNFHLQRIHTAARQGASRAILLAFDEAVIHAWRTLLAPNGETLAKDAEFILDFFSVGMREMFGPKLGCQTLDSFDVAPSSDCVREVFASAVRLACKAQGVSEEEFTKRVAELYTSAPISTLLG